MDHKKYRYNHVGIPTTKKLKNEKYLPEFDIYVSGYGENEFNVESLEGSFLIKCEEIVLSFSYI